MRKIVVLLLVMSITLVTGIAGAYADACPVTASSMSLGSAFFSSATTVGMTDDYRGREGCGDKPSATVGAPDVVYAFDLAQTGTFKLEVHSTSTGFNPAVYTRTACGVDWLCADFWPTYEISWAERGPGTIYVIVDGSGGTQGNFQMSVSLDWPACGDGVVNTGEQCDDGNRTDGDGCSASCMFEPSDPIAEKCTGEMIKVSYGLTDVLGSTYGYSDDSKGGCGLPGGSDRVYALMPSVSGTLTATLGLDASGSDICAADRTSAGCWDRVLYARATCNDANTQIACSDRGALTVESISFTVFAGGTYYIFVDGYTAQPYSRGPFDLRLDLH